MAHADVQWNFLMGIFPDELGDCENLQFVDLGSNLFFGSFPRRILSLRNLDYLSNPYSSHVPLKWSS